MNSKIDYIINRYKELGKISSEDKFNIIKGEMILKFNFRISSKKRMQNMMSEYKNLNSEIIDKETRNSIKEITKKEIESKYKEEFKKEHRRQLNKIVKNLSRKVGQREYMIDLIQNNIQQWKQLPAKLNINKIQNNNVQQIIITDIHRGKKGTNNVDKRLSYILSNILSNSAKNVDIIVLGDLVETVVQDGMHQGQIEYGMDYKYGFGFDLMMDTVNKLQWFLYEIYKTGRKVTFTGISGNHDRMGKTQQEDVNFTGALIIYEMLKRGLQNTNIKINYYNNVVSSIKLNGICYIIAHGYGNFDKRNPSELILEFGDPKMYNIIASGDKHHLNMKEYRNSTWIKVPALAGKGKYDTDNGFYSEPGYVYIEPNKFGTADITVKRLQRD